ncbi:hypothetical protein BU16DRAFT_555567 [Lophium mytilinum]|uniref:F-box domain-containing protein n=1 Tax=Lophium mytilinum TaxID=390894 RepID=A0A6A6RBI4_9PEZI|nr:hypothetical protein BU16DRAFT_555567 [Lophium mytilinum]
MEQTSTKWSLQAPGEKPVTLPEDVWKHICTFLDYEDALNAGKAGRPFWPFTTEQLARNLAVYPAEQSEEYTIFERVINTGHGNEVRQILFALPSRCIELSNPVKLDLALEQVRDKMKGFKKLVIYFHSYNDDMIDRIAPEQTLRFRQEMMRHIIQGMFNKREREKLKDTFEKDRKDKSAIKEVDKRVKSLTIVDLQDIEDLDLEQAPETEALLRGLESFQLSITRERREYGRLLGCSQKTLEFLNRLPNCWLNSDLLLNVTSLALCFPVVATFERVGPRSPMVDLSKCRFPKLQSLSLVNYGIWCERQLDWIFEHASTLKRLGLESCPIVYLFYCTSDALAQNEESLNNDLNDVEDYTDHTKYGNSYSIVHELGVFKTNVMWPDLFDKFRTKLPQLKEFYFDCQLCEASSSPPNANLQSNIGGSQMLGLDFNSYQAVDASGKLDLWVRIGGTDFENYFPRDRTHLQGQKDGNALIELLKHTGQCDPGDAGYDKQIEEFWEVFHPADDVDMTQEIKAV